MFRCGLLGCCLWALPTLAGAQQPVAQRPQPDVTTAGESFTPRGQLIDPACVAPLDHCPPIIPQSQFPTLPGNAVLPGRVPQFPVQEYIFDGHDRDQRVTVDPAWNVSGLDTEDTVGHYDTLSGQRKVTPSNRVAIYAPRFASVRKIDGLINAQRNQPVNAYEDKLQTVSAMATDPLTTTKQHLALNRFDGRKRASGLFDKTRGVTADNTTQLAGARNAIEAVASESLMVNGQFHMSLGPWVGQGMLSALAWESDLGLQVVAKGAQPVIVRDVATAQELLTVDSEHGTTLRVVKMASKIAAQVGEEVEFMIRFDNLSKQPIGNVTIMDNLTRRLEFVPGSASCTVEAEFVNEINVDESLLLRWEVRDPLEPGAGGVIRFKCRVR